MLTAGGFPRNLDAHTFTALSLSQAYRQTGGGLVCGKPYEHRPDEERAGRQAGSHEQDARSMQGSMRCCYVAALRSVSILS